MNSKLVMLSLLGLFALVGCNEKTTEDGDIVFCTAVYVPALRVDVFDKETGFPNACGVTVTVQDGDFTEELSNESGDSCNEDFTFSIAGEREGKYDITVIKDGYVDWIQYDTVVTSNICHVNTITVQAYMDK
ncbi:hypothetical protein ORJ66_16060 [Pseudoalteromonas tunicata]|uniref:hypothetical protein n=1 Tax=Pseudoalteromonas tunicata TaxID=314281 RepID=UPI00273E798E|nr:hypothetical protein [Pseudoalteromonas tunicata]MDP5214568.1 hypothetical protein [Pseudoalteromonas tunicata]